MKTRQEINREFSSGSYGTSLGTIVWYVVFATVLTLVVRWVC